MFEEIKSGAVSKVIFRKFSFKFLPDSRFRGNDKYLLRQPFFIVEMPGVEPGSETPSPKPTTCVFGLCLSHNKVYRPTGVLLPASVMFNVTSRYQTSR